ncbi:HD-GYP domain-containing protein [Undibacterium sp. 5I1]|uniref:HD-GYP domain-containing protein n=1 Tax=unclassified Undibacterium TaxID=2630295 RepID=UPI002AB3ED64|nr:MULTISPECIES: HD-GYP domain-containing protein [unclassified Undibacterium]MDY7539865.1 HD-GYP domain-containing protein [Undibacterium sp. 5I1]MEB0232457.1 HD-GYP domain-containing protein [Undibacterium sp. 10I3]MEB0256901.1 HD-GYP domain-containing protein [Undibacterium sp. 5I1]
MTLQQKLSQSLRVNIDDLRLGMFISELDRPWVNSPFMLQGFLLTESLDLTTMQSLVREVVIDPSRSAPSSLLHLPWDSVHELANQPEPPKLIASNKTIISQLSKTTVASGTPIEKAQTDSMFVFFWEWLDSLFKRPDKSPSIRNKKSTGSGKQPKPYYLRYASKERNNSQKTGSKNASIDRAERTSKLTPSSTFQFTQLITDLYPRDVMFARLSWVERWQNWRLQRSQNKTYKRGKNFRKLSARQRKRDYLPSSIPLVVYSDEIPIQEELRYARSGMKQADDILKKLSSDIQNDRSIALEEIQPTVQLLSESVIANPSALMWLVRMYEKNTSAYTHSLKVAIYMMTLGRHLGFSRQQLTELGLIGLLLDVGKLELPEDLLKKPDKLSDDENTLMRTHVAASIDILESKEPLIANVMLGISEHHERLDGSGYPYGLSGSGISIFGRMAAIADSFAAMTSARPYDITRSAFDAMKELFKQAGEQLHAPLVEEFVQAVGIFPVGSMIELSSGEVGIVLEHNKIRRLEPKVLLLTAADKNLLAKPNLLDLMRQESQDENEKMKILRGLPDGAYGLACKDFYN